MASSFLLSTAANDATSKHTSGDSQDAVSTRSSRLADDTTDSQSLASSSVEASRSSLLSEKLMKVFGFSQREDVIAEYPCYLLKSVLLQGHLFITQSHVSFFAYVPHKTNSVLKSGSLSKRNRTTTRYSRFWCVIRDNVLSYYNSASDLYFPVGSIDLRYAQSVEFADIDITEETAGGNPVAFVIHTQTRKHQFKADSYIFAQEWIKALQRAIFRAHNDGDSVKIVIPSENIIDVEESPFLDCADTFKIKAVDADNDEVTYTIDEYFFSFFSNGREAFTDLCNLVKYGPTDDHINSQATNYYSGSVYGDDDNGAETDPAKSDFITRPHTEPIRDSTESSGRPSAKLLSHLEPIKSPASSSPTSPNRSGFLRGRSSNPPVSSNNQQSLQIPAENDRTSPRIKSPKPVHRSSSTGSSWKRSSSPLKAIGGKVIDLITAGEKKGSLEISTRTPLTDTSEDMVEVAVSQSISASSDNTLISRSRDNNWSDWVKKGSKKVQSLLPTVNVPTQYVGKVTEMWIGNSKHFDGRSPGSMEEHDAENEATESDKESAERFRTHFSLPDSERLVASFYGYLHRVLPLYGKIYLGNRHLCFRSLLPGTKTKMILPYQDLENAEKERGFRFGYSGLVVVIHGHEEIFFEFRSAETRDDCAVTLLRELEEYRTLADDQVGTPVPTPEECSLIKSNKKKKQSILRAERRLLRSRDIFDTTPLIFESSRLLKDISIKPVEKYLFTCLTIGSRGDVQPYIALAKGLMADGHRVRIATHVEFKDWVEGHGIEFHAIAGDPAELMRISVEHGMFTYSFLKEASTKFRGWISDLLETSWVACQGSDVLIESPSAMAGLHIAEALRIPYIRAFTMPWTRTRAYPHAFAVPEQKMGGSYNYFTYVMFDNVFWKGISGQVNKWRIHTLHLPRTNLEKMQQNKVPFLYNFSPTVVPPPLDYSDWIKVTGYWFLDEGGNTYEPDPNLVKFIQDARSDGKKLVYIGFGSIVVAHPRELTQAVVESVIKADVRCILSKGWSDRLNNPDAHKTEVPIPSDSIYQIKSAPHDWLFPQIDAAVHHGGSGTTGASLRAGVPTVIKPFFGDQFFYASRVEDLGAGIHLKKLTTRQFAKALWEATHNERIIAKARLIGEQIQKENGVATAVETIYRDIHYARSLIRSISSKDNDEINESKKASEKDDGWFMVDETRSAEESETEQT
ncbi:hypothetical protein V1511DRAFT_459278 [Dipodascopsis uninucleata]